MKLWGLSDGAFAPTAIHALPHLQPMDFQAPDPQVIYAHHVHIPDKPAGKEPSLLTSLRLSKALI